MKHKESLIEIQRINRPIQSMEKSQFNLESLDVALDKITQFASSAKSDRADFHRLVNRSVVEFSSAETSLILAQNNEGDFSVISGEGKLLEQKFRDKIFYVLSQTKEEEQTRARQRKVLNSQIFFHSLSWQNWRIYYLVIQPVGTKQIDQSLILDLVSEVAFQLKSFEQNRASQHQQRVQKNILNVTQMIKNLGLSNGIERLAYIFSNDLMLMSNASRVSFVLASGKVLSVSSVSSFSKRTNLIRTISKLGKIVCKGARSVTWPQKSFSEKPTNHERKINALASNLGSAYSLLLPLKNEQRRSYGCIIVEYFNEKESSEFVDQRLMIEDCVSFVSPLIYRMISLYQIPGIKWLDWLFNRLLVKPVRLIGRFGILALVACCIGYLLFFWTWPFELRSQGTLKPATERHVFAPEFGNVKKIFVVEGTNVEAESKVVELESPELEQLLVEVQGELAEVRQRLKDLEITELDSDGADPQAQAAKIAAEIEVLKIREQTQQESFLRYQDRLKQLVVNSPINGQVTTPDLKQRLTARPLNRGDIIMTVADTKGPWELELLIPDRKIGYLIDYWENAGSVDFNFRLASDPDRKFVGNLDKIDFRVDMTNEEQISFVKVFVSVDEQELGESLRIGTRVYGGFVCGERNLFFLLTHELRDSLREWLFF